MSIGGEPCAQSMNIKSDVRAALERDELLTEDGIAHNRIQQHGLGLEDFVASVRDKGVARFGLRKVVVDEPVFHREPSAEENLILPNAYHFVLLSFQHS